jgi:myo-inositol 2-dehydrogenase / D-chiro-inositol 1-dehydrogenase
MLNDPTIATASVSRRQFIKTSSLVAASAAAAANFPAVLRAQASSQPIRAVIVGVGGRGGGAGMNFQEAVKMTGIDGKIVAVADLFAEQAQRAQEHFGVPAEKCFSGFDAFEKALAEPGVNYVILATPPGFRAPMFRACVEAGKNVFMEKPVAVDGVGVQMMYAAADASKEKNLKVAAGTQRRHQASYIETIKRIHDGAIGDVVTLRAYWVNGGPIWHYGDGQSHYGQRVGDTVLEKQLNNWYHYIWLCGDHICEQHVHNLDVCNWIMQDHPLRCWGQGSRQQLGNKSGEIWDNFDVEYEYPNGVHMFSYCGQIKREWSSVSEAVHGTAGTADPHHMIRPKDGKVWRYREKEIDPYVQEHIDLINAILKDTPLNEARQVADSTLTAIMGREAGYSGAGVSRDDVLNCKFAYGPEQLFKDCAKMQFGPYRTLQPPMPSQHNIFSDPPMVPVAEV